MRKRLPIAIATLVAVNLVIYQHASQLRDFGRFGLVGQTAPRLLPSMDDARPLRPESVATRIQSYSDGKFILTGQPTRQVKPVQYLEERRWTHNPQYSRPHAAPAVLSTRHGQPSPDFVALPHRPTYAPSPPVGSYGPTANAYEPAFSPADLHVPLDARAHRPARTNRFPRGQAPVPQQRQDVVIRLVQNESDVENFLLGKFDVPSPPGYEPPPAPLGYDSPPPGNETPTTDPSPPQPINVTRTAQNRLRFPDQSPGDYAVGPDQGSTPPATDADTTASSPPSQNSDPLPRPSEVLPGNADVIQSPQDPAAEISRPHPFEPAPDENLLRPPGGIPSANIGDRPAPDDLQAPDDQDPNVRQNAVDQPGPVVGELPGPADKQSPPVHDISPIQQPPKTQQAHDTPVTNQSDAKAVESCDDPHYAVFAKSQYPSARQCGECHKQIFEEWSVSSHAYAAISPMFHRFEQTLNSLTKGTIGYFCLRCHSPVGTTLSHPREESIWDSIPAAQEGVTCIVCHRVREHYGKVNGDRRIEPGDQFAPVYGSGNGEKLREIIAQKEHYKVKTSHADKGPGQKIHRRVIHFEQISHSEFCVSCHQVTVYPGIALEVVWAQYRASPACKEGISCQDCHMGAVPGQPYGYDTAPVAVVGDKEIDPGRKHSNHMFVGPGYSIAHPGIFPFRPTKVEDEDWTPEQWNQFDYRAGWGTEQFEQDLETGLVKSHFPAVWQNADDRADARELLDKNLQKLSLKKDLRRQLMEGSSKIHGPFFKHPPRRGETLRFKYAIQNLNSGHNMPSGSLGAQPQLWVNVALTGPDGRHLWESGYVDCNGDVADVHSLEVAKRRIRPDMQLVNFQSKFLITHVKGPDREMYLPVNTDIDQLPFIRPAGLPITVLNHPPTIRMEAHSVPPLGTKDAKYKIPGKVIRRPGVYRLSVRMRSRAEPVYFMRFCRSTPEMERRMQEHMLDFHEKSTTFIVK